MSDINVRIGGDNSDFKRALNDSAQAATRFGTETVKELNKKFSGVDIARGLMQGLGIGSIQQIANLIIAPFKKAAETATQLADITTQLADKQIAANRARLSDEQRYQLLLAEQSRLQESISSARAITDADQIKLAQDKITLLDKENQSAALLSKIEKDRAADLETANKDRERMQKMFDDYIKKSAEEEGRSRQNIYDIQQNADEAHLAAIKENQEILTLEAKAKRGLNEEDSARLALLRQQSKEAGNQQQIVTLLSLKNRTPEEEAVLQALIKQTAELQNQIPLAEKLKATQLETAAAIERANAAASSLGVAGLSDAERASVSDWILGGKRGAPPLITRTGSLQKSMADPLVEFGGQFLGPVRRSSDFDRASDAVLEEEIRRYKELIQKIQNVQSFGAPEVASGSFARNKAISQVQGNLNLASLALRQRASFRSSDFNTALRNYQGDPLNFDQLYQAAQKNLTESQQIKAGIDTLNKQLQTGITVRSIAL